MVNLKLEALARAGRNVRGLVLATVYNFVWAPMLGYGLARRSCTTRTWRWGSCW